MITPPSTLGILGGGQLGKYFVEAARTMGYRTVVLEPDAEAPAGKVADEHIVAAYDDSSALKRLGSTCAVVTTEFENPPARSMVMLAKHTIVHPSPNAVAIAQDRRSEKGFLTKLRIPIAPYAEIETKADVAYAADFHYPAILKTNRMGYDGKGQISVAGHDELAAAWMQLDRQPCVLEQRLRLDAEISVVMARSEGGKRAVYPVARNVHVNGILDSTTVPYSASRATILAERIAAGLEYVGVLAVEMFVVGGRL